MAGNRTEARDSAGQGRPADQHPAIDGAVTELLDHIAEELAHEYVRQMEKAADEEQNGADRNETEEG